MSSNNFSVAIVIVAYEEIELLGVTLSSLIESLVESESLASYEIIIVDNSRTDLVHKYILNAEFSYSVKYIHNKKNGFGLANNIGAINSNGDYLLFINPDISVPKGFFSSLEKKINIGERFFYAPVQYSNKGEKGLSFYYIDKFSLLSEILIKLFNFIGYFDNSKMYLSGALLILRREDFFLAGMFDEKLFMYYEEPDLTKRLLSIGVKAKLMKDISYSHYGGGSSSHLGIDMEEIRIQSFHVYSKKWGINYVKALKEMYFSSLIKYFIFSTAIIKDSSKAEYHKNFIQLLEGKIQ